MERLDPMPIRAIAFVQLQLAQVLSKQGYEDESLNVMSRAAGDPSGGGGGGGDTTPPPPPPHTHTQSTSTHIHTHTHIHIHNYLGSIPAISHLI